MKTTETDLYVLEWSRMHGATNVQPLESTLSSNRADYRDNRAASDFIPIAIGTQDEMRAASQAILPTLIGRAFELKEAV